MSKSEIKIIAKNRRASHDYIILETFEAGIALKGTEVRSLRDNNCSLSDCFAFIRQGEAWLNNLYIAPFANGTFNNPEPRRKRKLLLHKKEIRKLHDKTATAGMALVPLSIYFNKEGRVKVELALAKGKKLYDKRESIKEKTTQREVERHLKERFQ